VEVEFQHSHIDRMPVGDLGSTFITLLVTSPEIHWIFRYQGNEQVFEFDDRDVKSELIDIPLSEPGVLAYLRDVIQDGVTSAQPTRIEPLIKIPL
jgi:hypothetical protein